MGTLCREDEHVFNSSCRPDSRHVPASLEVENQLPAPAGLCLSWLLGTFLQTISEHLLLSSESCMGKSTSYGNAHVLPPLPGHLAFQHSSGTMLLAWGVLFSHTTQHFTTADALIFTLCPPPPPSPSPSTPALRWVDEFPLASPCSWKRKQDGIKGFKLTQQRWKMLPKDRRKRLSSEI